ncbi:HNH endonuclease [Rhodovulum sp. BSW8]|uniref:HNH endonuclease n=1 Tax=Rhodovulum sp. BSW8 TaxID=2259645 RepID=UPI000DE1E85F|nr:HNH endonuclease signature motif containing protein [Rhodovulum sp. BSW8]RBO54057.1 HNH endonuclease [Rhodovulum sp. BSW8]
MARLKMLRSATPRLSTGLGYLAADRAAQSRSRDARLDYRKWYKTARWQRLRWAALVRDHFRCRRCGAVHPQLTAECDALAAIGQLDLVTGSAPGFVADHIVPHRGDAGLFWDRANLQCLCKACHDRAKQREEAATR